MFCLYCGADIPDDAVFCNKCGKSQKTATNVTTQGTSSTSTSSSLNGQTASRGTIPPEISKFIEYLEANRGIRSMRHIVALATHAANPPTLFNTLPRGDVFLYPRFLVFLTLTQGSYGAGMLVGKMVQEGKALIKLHTMLAHPASFLVEAAKSLTEKYSREGILENALNNPNSIFIPLDEVTSAIPEKNWFQGSYIKISMSGGKNAVLCQDMNRENLFKSSKGYFGNWEPELVGALQDAVRRNRVSNRL